MSKKYWNVFVIFILNISIITTGSLVYAQEIGASNQGENEPAILENEVAEPVTLGDEVLFYIKNPAGEYSAQERAQKISEELKTIAETRAIDLDNLEIEQQGEASLIILKKVIATLTAPDFNSEEESREELENKYLQELNYAINRYRENSEINLVNPLGTVLLTLILFGLIIWPIYDSRLKIFLKTINERYEQIKNSFFEIFNNESQKEMEEKKYFLDKYKVGELDSTGKLIEYIYHSSEDYIVCRTSKLVQWLLNRKSEKCEEYIKRINGILELLTKIESKNPEEIDKVETINLLTAKGIKLALEGEEEASKKILQDADKRLQSFRSTYAKVRYLIDSFYAASSIIFTLLLLISVPKLFPSFFINIIETFNISEMFLVVVSCGALGGFLSVAYGINRINVDPDFDIRVTATSRIFIAVISSIIVYITLRANLFSDLSEFLLNEQTSEFYLWRVGFISVVAGFTESFVPNILNLPNRATNNQQAGKSNSN